MLEEQHEKFVAGLKKLEKLAVTEVKMSGSEKIVNKNTYDISSMRKMFFSKLQPKIPFLRSHETLLSHLMNSTDFLFY